VSVQGEPGPDDERAARLRWIARAVVAAIGLWFLADGLRGVWAGAGPLAQVLIVVGVLLGGVLAVLGLLQLRRRGRDG
jgi:hypothetical protein